MGGFGDDSGGNGVVDECLTTSASGQRLAEQLYDSVLVPLREESVAARAPHVNILRNRHGHTLIL